LNDQEMPSVSIMIPSQKNPEAKLTLHGEMLAWHDAPVYAKIQGYVKNWYVDYGASVKANQLLAEIDTPDLDAEFAEAQARLKSAQSAISIRQAELEFAKSTYERWRDAPQGVVSVQATTEKKNAFETAAARLSAAMADSKVVQDEVQRLQSHETLRRITAPFDGIVTERNTDIGAPVGPAKGNDGQDNPPLFRVADVHKVRVFVKVPQAMTGKIAAGAKAILRLPQFPGKQFEAVVVTNSGAIDVHSGTLLVELNADNPDGALQPGSRAEVQFEVESNATLNGISAP
jgi:RND family efflux transporter MFP subunit